MKRLGILFCFITTAAFAQSEQSVLLPPEDVHVNSSKIMVSIYEDTIKQNLENTLLKLTEVQYQSLKDQGYAMSRGYSVQKRLSIASRLPSSKDVFIGINEDDLKKPLILYMPRIFSKELSETEAEDIVFTWVVELDLSNKINLRYKLREIRIERHIIKPVPEGVSSSSGG